MRKSRTGRTATAQPATEVPATQRPPTVIGEAQRVLRFSERCLPVPGWIVSAGHERALAVFDGHDAVWEFAGAEHVWTARDVLRTHEGLAALMEPCPTSLALWLDQQAVHTGEAVTVALSALRGLRELGAGALEQSGEWWLTETGRPVFVHTSSGRAAPRATVELLHALCDACDDRALHRLVSTVVQSLGDPLVALTHIAAWEEQLLELAAPRPLCPERAPEHAPDEVGPTFDAVVLRAHVPDPRSPVSPRVRHRARQGNVLALARLRETTAAVRDAVSRVERLQRIRSRLGRPRPMLVAAAIAAVVVGVGVLWPDAAPVAEASAVAAVEAPSEVVFASDPTPQPLASTAPAAPAAESTLAIAEAIVADLIGCAATGDFACTHLRAGEATVLNTSLAEAGDYTVDIVEEFGDVVVARVRAGELNEIVVLERINENWLLREVYTVAEQPAVGTSEP